MKKMFEEEDIDFLAHAVVKLLNPKLQEDSTAQDYDPYIDMQGLAEYMGVDESMITRQIKRGLPYENNGNFIRFQKSLIIEWSKRNSFLWESKSAFSKKGDTVMGKIYKPQGRAGQVGEYAVTLYRGCSHGCKYCYASKMAARFGWGPFNTPEPSKDVIANILKAAHKYRGREVFMCFSTDCYQPIDVKFRLTRQAIKILHDNEVAVRILTKGGKRSERDFDLLAARPNLGCYGATLTFLDEGLSKTWEPGAALPESRLAALEKAHRSGIKTWASLEPVIDPDQSLALIKRTHKYVGLFVIGKWNYNALAKNIDWHAYVHGAIAQCEKYGTAYYVKQDLAKHI